MKINIEYNTNIYEIDSDKGINISIPMEFNKDDNPNQIFNKIYTDLTEILSSRLPQIILPIAEPNAIIEREAAAAVALIP